jgi:hypothetical protein
MQTYALAYISKAKNKKAGKVQKKKESRANFVIAASQDLGNDE